jgi:hypothetical protein
MVDLRLRTRLTACAALAASCLFFNSPVQGQDESRRVRSGRVKVGDRIMADPTSTNSPNMVSCVVLSISVASYKPGYDGDYKIQCDHSGWSSVSATEDHMRVIPQTAASARPVATGVQATASNTVAAAPVQAVAVPRPAGGNAFGTRNPRTCPASGPGTPSLALAAELVACAREWQSRRSESLVDNVRVTSLVKSQYNPYTQTGFTNMDTSVPPMAITGSLLAWSCREQDPPTAMAKYSNIGKNCSRGTETHATGYCWKQRTGSWSCDMSDTGGTITDKQYDVLGPT